MKSKDVLFLNKLQEQMLLEDKHDNDIQASPRFWVLRDKRIVPTHEDYADRTSYYFNNGDFKEFESTLELQQFLSDFEDDMDYYGIIQSEWNEYVKDESIDFEVLWEWVLDNLNPDDYFNEVPVKEEYYIVPNTLFLTKKEAKEYIKTYGYNHTKDVHTYAMTALRSPSVAGLFDILHHAEFKTRTDHENLAKVTYAYGLVFGNNSDWDWEDLEEYSHVILNDWHSRIDIKDNNEEGYIIPYAIRKWEEKQKKD